MELPLSTEMKTPLLQTITLVPLVKNLNYLWTLSWQNRKSYTDMYASQPDFRFLKGARTWQKKRWKKKRVLRNY
jgi:hypothetical protein